MEVMITILCSVMIVLAIFLVIAVLMQSGKDNKLSGTIAGGAETFFGKTKGKTADRILSKVTTVVSVIFVVLVLLVYVMQGVVSNNDTSSGSSSGGSNTKVEETVTEEETATEEETVTAEEIATEETNTAE